MGRDYQPSSPVLEFQKRSHRGKDTYIPHTEARHFAKPKPKNPTENRHASHRHRTRLVLRSLHEDLQTLKGQIGL